MAFLMVLTFFLLNAGFLWIAGFIFQSEMGGDGIAVCLLLAGILTALIYAYLSARRRDKIEKSASSTSMSKGHIDSDVIGATGNVAQKESEKNNEGSLEEPRRIRNVIGAVVVTVLSLVAAGRLFELGYKAINKLPQKSKVVVPKEETWEDVKAQLERRLRGDK